MIEHCHACCQSADLAQLLTYCIKSHQIQPQQRGCSKRTMVHQIILHHTTAGVLYHLQVITEDMPSKESNAEAPDFATSPTLDSEEVARRVGGDVDLRQGETLKVSHRIHVCCKHVAALC